MAESSALIKASSTSAATAIEAAVSAGTLWGLDMGTTTQAAAYSRYCVVRGTPPRLAAMEEVMPSNAEIVVFVSDTESFTGATDTERLWFLLGVAEGL